MSSHEHLSAASNDRKARLAQLKSLKRKQPDTSETPDTADATALTTTSTTPEEEPSVTTTYLSGRNFDPTTRNVKLGFTAPPVGDSTQTLEYKAAQLALQTQGEAEKEAKEADAPLDLFKLQPKRANWDLKRDLEQRVREGGLEVAWERAVVRLVRERVEAQKGGSGAGGESMDGGELVAGMHVREVEEERERAREEVEG